MYCKILKHKNNYEVEVSVQNPHEPRYNWTLSKGWKHKDTTRESIIFHKFFDYLPTNKEIKKDFLEKYSLTTYKPEIIKGFWFNKGWW